MPNATNSGLRSSGRSWTSTTRQRTAANNPDLEGAPSPCPPAALYLSSDLSPSASICGCIEFLRLRQRRLHLNIGQTNAVEAKHGLGGATVGRRSAPPQKKGTKRGTIEHQSSTNRAPIEHQSSTNRAPIEHQSSTNRAPIEHQSRNNKECLACT